MQTGRPPTFSPEYEDCARIASEQNVPLREVYRAAQEAAVRSEPQPTPNPQKPDSAPHEHDHPH